MGVQEIKPICVGQEQCFEPWLQSFWQAILPLSSWEFNGMFLSLKCCRVYLAMVNIRGCSEKISEANAMLAFNFGNNVVQEERNKGLA